jgi:hypothetical protein
VSHSAQHGNVNDAVEAIETELGIHPSGSYATVLARLDALESMAPRPAWAGGFLAWTYDPHVCTVGTAPAANGTVHVVRLWTPQPISVTNVHLYVMTAGATLTAGQNFAALYDGTKALLGTSSDASAVWNTTGLKTHALVGGPDTVPAGDFFVAYFATATTRPAFARVAASSPLSNGRLSAPNSRWATADTGRTTSMPATLGTFTGYGTSVWAAVS